MLIRFRLNNEPVEASVETEGELETLLGVIARVTKNERFISSPEADEMPQPVEPDRDLPKVGTERRVALSARFHPSPGTSHADLIVAVMTKLGRPATLHEIFNEVSKTPGYQSSATNPMDSVRKTLVRRRDFEQTDDGRWMLTHPDRD